MHGNCRASIGALGNANSANIQFGKAGRMRWMGFAATTAA